MAQLNAAISDDAHAQAKAAADRAGMLLRKWVERALLRQAEAESARKETRYERID